MNYLFAPDVDHVHRRRSLLRSQVYSPEPYYIKVVFHRRNRWDGVLNCALSTNACCACLINCMLSGSEVGAIILYLMSANSKLAHDGTVLVVRMVNRRARSIGQRPFAFVNIAMIGAFLSRQFGKPAVEHLGKRLAIYNDVVPIFAHK